MKLTTQLMLAAALGLATPLNASNQVPLKNKKDNRPNIVVVLTDDQDLHMDSINYMPLLKKNVIDHGTFFKRHFCSTAICCPSRATLWTGRNAHNTNVTDVFPPHGGYSKFVTQGWNKNWLPLWIQAAGYNTFYTGKLFNDHTVENWNSPKPSGWTGSDFLLDPFTYEYLNATFQRNDQPPVSYEGLYSTDILAEKAYGFLEQGISAEKPFFLVAAPVAPHSNVKLGGLDLDPKDPDILDKVGMSPPIPATRHKDLFPDVRVPRRANFNPEKASGAGWVKSLNRLNDTVIAYNDNFYRRRLQALQAVDELVEGLVTRLTNAGVLDNTYIFYTTDNGYHISQHRLNPGKECGFEEDINIPLVIRGPGVQVGKEEQELVTAHTDLAPTFLEIVNGRRGKGAGWEGLDGAPIPFVKAKGEGRQEHVNVEFWGLGIPEGKYHLSLDDGRYVFYGANNTYKALRIVGKGYNLYYSVWCTNEHELYDLTVDPHQLNNIYPSPSSSSLSSLSSSEIPSLASNETILSLPLSKVIPRLDALLLVTKSCKAATCTDPWSVIHPRGDVKTLADAVSGKFDGFYEGLRRKKRVGFSKCELGYIKESEGDQVLGGNWEDYEAGKWEL